MSDMSDEEEGPLQRRYSSSHHVGYNLSQHPLPPGAVRLTKNEIDEMHRKAIIDWRPKREM